MQAKVGGCRRNSWARAAACYSQCVDAALLVEVGCHRLSSIGRASFPRWASSEPLTTRPQVALLGQGKPEPSIGISRPFQGHPPGHWKSICGRRQGGDTHECMVRHATLLHFMESGTPQGRLGRTADHLSANALHFDPAMGRVPLRSRKLMWNLLD